MEELDKPSASNKNGNLWVKTLRVTAEIIGTRLNCVEKNSLEVTGSVLISFELTRRMTESETP